MAAMAHVMDDFDYPMPKRETNWTLKTEDQHLRKHCDAPHRVNRTDDIAGAVTGTTALYRTRQFQHKPNLFGVSDIAGASPTRLIPEKVTKPNDRNLHNQDIEHSFPESKLFSTPRIVDPLAPVYPLPSVKHRAPTPPLQRYETNKISDIDGTRPKPHWTRSKIVNPLDYSDVPFSTAGSHLELQKRKSPSVNLTTKDINETRQHIGARSLNPLDPIYMISLPTGEKVPLGQIAGSKPRHMANLRNDRPLLSLRSSDIEGCQPMNRIPFPRERRQWKNTNDVSDIDTKGRRVLH